MRTASIALLILAACATTQAPTQRIALTSSSSSGRWAPVGSALDGCARSFQLGGNVEAQMQLDDHGKVVAVESPSGSAFAGCVGKALLSSSFREHANASLLFQLAVVP